MVQHSPRCRCRFKKEIAALLLQWFEKNGRKFPWRGHNEPYEVLIAEVMLQRTKADQVAPVYVEFMKRFPDLASLSRASKAQVARYFASLGLIHRAELVSKLTRDLVERFSGRIPSTRPELLSLPSVGDYVADAVLCFAFGKDVSVVDTNVCRVIGRVYGLNVIGEARRDPMFKQTMEELLPIGHAKEFNWAIIDLASIACLPRKPLHSMCPLIEVCEYARSESVQNPLKQRRKKLSLK